MPDSEPLGCWQKLQWWLAMPQAWQDGVWLISSSKVLYEIRTKLRQKYCNF